MSEEFQAPQTRREWLMSERKRLYQALSSAQQGQDDLISGRITSYSLGSRTITRYAPDLKTLSEFISKAQNRIAEIEAILNGRPIRHVSRCVFLDPTLIKRGF